MIQFTATVLPGAPDVVKTTLYVAVDGSPETSVAINSNGGDVVFNVPAGSSGKVTSTYTDAAGNESGRSPEAVFENASDTTPPASPAGAPTLGAGETVPD